MGPAAPSASRGSEQLAALMDGPGERFAARRAARDVVPSVPEHLALSKLSPKTIQKHVDNMWVLGGELITELNYTPSLRKAPVEKVLADLIKDRAPILHHGEQRRSRLR